MKLGIIKENKITILANIGLKKFEKYFVSQYKDEENKGY